MGFPHCAMCLKARSNGITVNGDKYENITSRSRGGRGGVLPRPLAFALSSLSIRIRTAGRS